MRSKTNAIFITIHFVEYEYCFSTNIYYLSYGMIARSSGNDRMFATCSVIDNSCTLNISLNNYADLKFTANEIFINQSKGYIIITVSL